MSAPSFAVKDAATILSEVLAAYKAATVTAARPTGVALQPADPRRILIQTIVSYLAQHRAIIDHAGKQNLLRYVGDEWIDEFAAVWDEPRITAARSTCTQRFNASGPSTIVIPAGKRVTDGTNVWRVVTAATSAPGSTYLDVTVECTVVGSATNGVAIGQIDTMVDDIPGVVSTENLTETISGREIESLEDFRERLRDAPESSSPAGPYAAYRAHALRASSNVEDAVPLGPDDAPYMTGTAPTPGEVHIIVMEKDLATPSAGLLAAVLAYLSAEDVRPLGDSLTVKAPEFVDFDVDVTYYVARSRAEFVAEIHEAVAEAYAAYATWQRKIGRDINPDELVKRLLIAGAKRVYIGSGPSFTALDRDQCSRANYEGVTFGGVEDD